MTRTSDGITSLLTAEKKAVEKIEDAKKNKVRRLKAAKEDADKEIEGLQRTQEEKFRKVQSANVGSKDAMSQKVDEETAARLKSMESDVASNREKIIKRILDMVYEISPKMHENARFEEQPQKPETLHAPRMMEHKFEPEEEDEEEEREEEEEEHEEEEDEE